MSIGAKFGEASQGGIFRGIGRDVRSGVCRRGLAIGVAVLYSVAGYGGR